MSDHYAMYCKEFEENRRASACIRNLRSEKKQLQAELAVYRWIPVGERLPDKVKYYAVTDGLEWWRELWCFVDHSGAKGWEDNPDVITHYMDIMLPEGVKA